MKINSSILSSIDGFLFTSKRDVVRAIVQANLNPGGYKGRGNRARRVIQSRLAFAQFSRTTKINSLDLVKSLNNEVVS